MGGESLRSSSSGAPVAASSASWATPSRSSWLSTSLLGAAQSRLANGSSKPQPHATRFLGSSAGGAPGPLAADGFQPAALDGINCSQAPLPAPSSFWQRCHSLAVSSTATAPVQQQGGSMQQPQQQQHLRRSQRPSSRSPLGSPVSQSYEEQDEEPARRVPTQTAGTVRSSPVRTSRNGVSNGISNGPSNGMCSDNGSVSFSSARGSSSAVRQAVAPAVPMGKAATDLCFFCFQVLTAHLRGKPAPAYPSTSDPLFRAPLFVTWLKKRRMDRSGVEPLGEPELRGCIGCLEPVVFRPGLSEYALRSSLQDRRFPPVLLEEVPSLICKLSILYQFEACQHAYDWVVGVHGILINFSDSRERTYSATYLPEIAKEHGMTQAVAIRELVVKAGYSGPCDQELISRIQATRYKSIQEGVGYREFVQNCGGGEAGMR
eukprot:TRINITY_DN14796_c0_g1_i1.p1 TRINITY_DN14796_c0_g1~~TRINITY_DN14796_c0_g1_i1.p1  ORF type:complete len:432 (-),score=70.18 TRINITY_DN14796_c0_g1_i1:140-1435(-)